MNSIGVPTLNTAIRADFASSAAHEGSRANRNLYDLFIDEISSISACTNQTFDAAIALYEWLPPEQFRLREATHGFAMKARACAQGIDDALRAELLKLPRSGAPSANALVQTIMPGRYENAFEPWGVVGIRIASTLRKISLLFWVQSGEAAEFGFLLGADALHRTFRHWAEQWRKSARQLQLTKSSFWAAAYMADVDFPRSFHPSASRV